MENDQGSDTSLRQRLCLAAGFLICLIFIPHPAWAVQTHGSTEGFVSHELGHILFFGGMAFLLFQIQRKGWTDRGWLRFKFFLIFILCWNILTFTSHWLREYVAPDKFVLQNGHVTAYSVSSLFDVAFYLSSLDHIFLVPAFLFLGLALKSWRARE